MLEPARHPTGGSPTASAEGAVGAANTRSGEALMTRTAVSVRLIAGAPVALLDHARAERPGLDQVEPNVFGDRRQEGGFATDHDRIAEHAQLVDETELDRCRGQVGVGKTTRLGILEGYRQLDGGEVGPAGSDPSTSPPSADDRTDQLSTSTILASEAARWTDSQPLIAAALVS